MSKGQNREDQESDPLRLASEPQVPQALFILHSTQHHQLREKGKGSANSRQGTSALCRSLCQLMCAIVVPINDTDGL